MQEERLIYVQAELKRAQKRWSESQNIWLDEVPPSLFHPLPIPIYSNKQTPAVLTTKQEHRLQELKRHHKKHTKLTQTPPPRPALKSLSWRLKSWRSQSLSESGTATPAEGFAHSPTTPIEGTQESNSPTTDLFASTNPFASTNSPEADTPDEHNGEDSDALPSPPPLGQQRRRLTWSTTPSFPPTLTRAATFASAAGSSSGISQAHGKGGDSRKGRLGDALRRMSFSGRRGSAV